MHATNNNNQIVPRLAILLISFINIPQQKLVITTFFERLRQIAVESDGFESDYNRKIYLVRITKINFWIPKFLLFKKSGPKSQEQNIN